MSEQLPSDVRARTIGEYLVALSSGSPTPGGGSAAGLAGAFGCALGAMVCNLTLARTPSEDLSRLVTQFDELAEALIDLARQDEDVFASYRAATALPREGAEDKAIRRAAIEQALVDAADVPLRMVDTGIAAMELLEQAAEVGSTHALGDVLTGAHLLRAMALGALVNISSNAQAMKEPENRQRFAAAVSEKRAALEHASNGITAAVSARTEP